MKQRKKEKRETKQNKTKQINKQTNKLIDICMHEKSDFEYGLEYYY